MKPTTWIYAAFCVMAVSYVLIANMRGYIPFATASAAERAGSGGGGHGYGSGTAGHFHK